MLLIMNLIEFTHIKLNDKKLFTQYDKADELYLDILSYMNELFTALFLMECILKLISYGCRVLIIFLTSFVS